MALEVLWTQKLITGVEKIVDYLNLHFGPKQVQSIIQQLFEKVELLSEFPELLPAKRREKYLRRGPINAYSLITYKIRP